MMMDEQRTIAYFSMEIGLDPEMPTYSGGLGILAGDTIRSAADLKVPMVAVTLLYRKGYFYQRLDETGWQREEPVQWINEDYLKEMRQRTTDAMESCETLYSWYRLVRCDVQFHVVTLQEQGMAGENSQRNLKEEPRVWCRSTHLTPKAEQAAIRM
jgi:starch phosphorylase